MLLKAQNNMKKIILMATMMVAALTASAQYDAGTWSLNIRYGFTGATMINTPDMDLYSALGPSSPIAMPDGSVEASATGRRTIGLELERQLTKKFSISGGLDWIHAGTGWEDHKWKVGNVDYKLEDASIKTYYLAVPITANFYVWKGLALHAGVQAAYLTGARREGKVTYDEDDCDYSVSMGISGRSEFNKFDFSIPVGISYEWGTHLFFDARYNIGLTNVGKDKTFEGKDLKNAYLQLTVGYKIKLSD